MSDHHDQRGDAADRLLAEAQSKISNLKHKYSMAEASKTDLIQRLAEVEAALETVSETARRTESAQAEALRVTQQQRHDLSKRLDDVSEVMEALVELVSEALDSDALLAEDLKVDLF